MNSLIEDLRSTEAGAELMGRSSKPYGTRSGPREDD